MASRKTKKQIKYRCVCGHLFYGLGNFVAHMQQGDDKKHIDADHERESRADDAYFEAELEWADDYVEI